ncbi:MAG: nucleotidyltransferase family protein, partial [Actinomycetota bacterium]
MITAAVVLAAGAGSRFDGPDHKLLAEIGGRPVVSHVLDAVLEADIGPVLVVTGAVRIGDVLPASTREVPNPRWAEGQATSVLAGVEAADELGADAIVVGLGDQPGVPAAAWRRVAASSSPIAVATYGGRRRNPVRLARSIWPELPRDGDQGARGLIEARPDLVDGVACPGNPDDIDTQEDLQ